MDNFTKISLSPRKNDLVNASIIIRKSMAVLSDQASDYAEHHQHLINTYSLMIDVIDRAIEDSETIGHETNRR